MTCATFVIAASMANDATVMAQLDTAMASGSHSRSRPLDHADKLHQSNKRASFTSSLAIPTRPTADGVHTLVTVLPKIYQRLAGCRK